MHTSEELRDILRRIDGRGYKAYKEISGVYRFPSFQLYIDHVQGDPFASPSKIRIRFSTKEAGFPREAVEKYVYKVAAGDFLTRQVGRAIHRIVKGHRGTGKSGMVAIDTPGQQILERTSILIDPDWIEARMTVGLPAAGRTVLGRQAEEIFFTEIPAVVKKSLFYHSLDETNFRRHLQAAEEAELIREELKERGLVAFVANGSILPRMSGVDDRPLASGEVIPFHSPPELEVSFTLPYSGKVVGMGIPAGITLIVGGGYHGKSTLLRALEKGVYNHIPGDGREQVITLASAVKIRAEDGRAVTGVDISPFINHLPLNQDTTLFTTANASGSTSQAANISEALEVGAELLLLDEDTSATNFLIRDERMQELVVKEKEPITPLLDQIIPLKEAGISTILVLGGSGDYLDVADTVIMMDNFRPVLVTEKAMEVRKLHPSRRRPERVAEISGIRPRIPRREGIDPSKGRHKVKIKARGTDEIGFGEEEIDLSAVEQVVDDSQVRCIGETLHYLAENLIDGKRNVKELMELWEEKVDAGGLDAVVTSLRGDFARPRRFEVAAALNRLRTLKLARPK